MKLDSELKDKLVKAIREGLTIDIACDYVEINRSTFFRWKKEGAQLSKEIDEGDRKYYKLTDRQKLLVDLLTEIRKALATCEHDLLQEVRKGERGWQSQAWTLERRFRERWAKRTLVDDEAYIKDIKRRFGSVFERMQQRLLDAGEATLASMQTYDEPDMQGEQLQEAAGIQAEGAKDE